MNLRFRTLVLGRSRGWCKNNETRRGGSNAGKLLILVWRHRVSTSTRCRGLFPHSRVSAFICGSAWLTREPQINADARGGRDASQSELPLGWHSPAPAGRGNLPRRTRVGRLAVRTECCPPTQAGDAAPSSSLSGVQCFCLTKMSPWPGSGRKSVAGARFGGYPWNRSRSHGIMRIQQNRGWLDQCSLWCYTFA